MLLFLLGLLTGAIVPALRNPRLGLSAHLEGVMSGVFLMAVGATWHYVRFSTPLLRLTFWLLDYGTFANWAFTLGGVWGAARIAATAASTRQSSQGLSGPGHRSFHWSHPSQG